MLAVLVLFAQRVKHPPNQPWYESLFVELVAFSIFGGLLWVAGWVYYSCTKEPPKEEPCQPSNQPPEPPTKP